MIQNLWTCKYWDVLKYSKNSSTLSLKNVNLLKVTVTTFLDVIVYNFFHILS